MTREDTPNATAGLPEMRDALGDSDTRVDSREEVLEATLALIEQTRSRLRLYTLDLEHPVLNQTAVIDAVHALVRRNRDLRFEILILDSRKAIGPGHRLIELARKLGPQVEFRQPHPLQRSFKGTFLLADNQAYLFRPRADRYRGTVNYDDSLRGARLSTWFEQIWADAEPDLETRQLFL